MADLNRRKFLGAAGGVLAATLPQTPAVKPRHPDVVVVGAGIFGACSAYFLRQRGLSVLLLDAWGVAHPRATSGGETRVIRSAYGTQALYTRWAWEALRVWARWQREWRTELFHPTGVLWLAKEETEYVRASLRHLAKHKIPVERLTVGEVVRRFPQFAPLDTRQAYLEPKAGVLLARKACRAVVSAFDRLGGRFHLAAVKSPLEIGATDARKLDSVRTIGGEKISAGIFVFACGPWLRELFPAALHKKIRVTKQDVFFFGVPSGSQDFDPPRFPTWVDIGTSIGYYGIPALDGRGVKIASDEPGPPFDPTHGQRTVSPDGLAGARRYLAARFPALKDAPLAETRVCQYERTPDSHLILDRHPEWENVWIVGGGSGHGFKLGPVVGRTVATRVADNRRDAIPAELRFW